MPKRIMFTQRQIEVIKEYGIAWQFNIGAF